MDTNLPDQPVRFTANISGADPAVTPKFEWSVPGFRILSGGETAAIAVEPPKHGGTVEATVIVKGYDPGCSITSSCTTSIISCPTAVKIEEYGDIGVGGEKRRLDIFTEELRKDPTAQGYLLCYGGRRSRASVARRRCDRARNFLVISRGIDAPRIVTMDAGYREKPTVELWVVPTGAISLPLASPTVDPKDVRPPRKPRGHVRR